jgi:hypothetical protein
LTVTTTSPVTQICTPAAAPGGGAGRWDRSGGSGSVTSSAPPNTSAMASQTAINLAWYVAASDWLSQIHTSIGSPAFRYY